MIEVDFTFQLPFKNMYLWYLHIIDCKSYPNIIIIKQITNQPHKVHTK